MDWVALLIQIFDVFIPIGLAAVAAAFTPNSSRNKAADLAWRSLNVVAMNVRQARNR